MKKKIYLLAALLLVAAVSVVGVLFFANRESQISATVAPETPVIGLAEDLSVYWERVENTDSYLIYVNGIALVSTENTSFSVLSVPGTYTIQVQAVNKAGKSNSSNEVSYQTLGVTIPTSELYTVLGNPVAGYGQDYTFTLELAEGCTQCEPVVKVNDQVVMPDAGGRYVVSGVTENLAVTVEGVTRNVYSITLPTGAGYTLSGEPVADYGTNYAFTLALDKSHSKSKPVVKANGVELALRNGSYVIENVTKPQVITVSGITRNIYTVNLATGRGYKISPSGEQKVSHGESVKFKVTAESSSYKLVVQANGRILSANNGEYSIADITSDVQVMVTVSGLPALSVSEAILDPKSWNTGSAMQDGNSVIVSANSTLKAAYLKGLWDAGYTHLIFTVNAKAAVDNNTNFTHSGRWDRYWLTFDGEKDVDIRVDLNEFHDGNVWYGMNFNAGTMTVSNPRVYKSPETLSWKKSNSNIYFAIEDGYYVLETRGNDFGVTSPTQWLKKYVVKDDAGQRTWMMYTDYITQGNNTRSMLWGWGSPVNTIHSDVSGGWAWNNNVQSDGYTEGEVFSLQLDRSGVARFKILDWVSNRNEWNSGLAISYEDAQTVRWSASSDYKLRLATTQDLIAAGYTTLRVALTGNLGNGEIWYGEDDWSDGEIAVTAKDFINDTCTFEVDLTSFKYGENFTMMVNAATFTNMIVHIQPIVLESYNVTFPSGVGYTISGGNTAISGKSYSFTLTLQEGYTNSNPLVKVNGVEVAGAADVYTVDNVQGDITVTVENILLNTYTVTKPVGTNYTFSGADTVKHGESYTFSVTAEDPQIPVVVLVNDSVVTGTDGIYTIDNVVTNLKIAVQATMPEASSVKNILRGDSWIGTVLSSNGNSLKLAASPTLKAQYLKALWDEGYTHLVFTVNAKAAADNNTNYTHSGVWSRYWATFAPAKEVDLRIDLNEFHDGDTWNSLVFNAGIMTVSNPRAYKSAETLNWIKDNSSTYFAIEDGYYVLETHGNDFGVTSPTQWLKKYVVKDDAGQRTWMMYTDYIAQGKNTRSMLCGWGSAVNTINNNVNGGWSWLNNAQTDGYTNGEVFSLHLDRAGVARFKMLDWVSNRNSHNSALGLSYLDAQTICWNAATDYKIRLATTQELIAAGYTTLKVTLNGNLGNAEIWYGEDDWSDGEIGIKAKDFVNGTYTFMVDLTTFKVNENFTLLANGGSFTNLQITIEPIANN